MPIQIAGPNQAEPLERRLTGRTQSTILRL
jgi:hypothetical protein